MHCANSRIVSAWYCHVFKMVHAIGKSICHERPRDDVFVCPYSMNYYCKIMKLSWGWRGMVSFCNSLWLLLLLRLGLEILSWLQFWMSRSIVSRHEIFANELSSDHVKLLVVVGAFIGDLLWMLPGPALEAAQASSDGDQTPDKSKKKNRCFTCRKKVGLTGKTQQMYCSRPQKWN